MFVCVCVFYFIYIFNSLSVSLELKSALSVYNFYVYLTVFLSIGKSLSVLFVSVVRYALC